MNPEDTKTHQQVMEALKRRLETYLKNTSDKLNKWLGGYQHLLGMWKHKEAEREAAERYIQEIQHYLWEITDTRRVWTEIKQEYEAELEDNAQSLKAVRGMIEVSHEQTHKLIRDNMEIQET